MRHLYTFLFYLAIPFILLRLRWRSRRIPVPPRFWRERWGYTSPLTKHHSIWIHAVSVGETMAAIPLIRALQQQYPHYALVVTTTTPTAAQQVSQQLSHSVQHAYIPYDLPRCIHRFLRRCRPVLCILMETELWPNLIHCTHAHRIPILLANARLSERSLRGYQRIPTLIKTMLHQLSHVATQSDADGKRFLKLGLPSEKLQWMGNIKFDLQLPASILTEGQQWRSHWNNRPTLIAASTHEGEEEKLLHALPIIQHSIPDILLILVPRHPQRFSAVAELCRSLSLRFVQRSLQQWPDTSTSILLGDTLGELRTLYAASDVAFVGGSLVPVGGHNLIEPAAVHLPIVTGSHLHHFEAVRQLLEAANALIVVDDATALIHHVVQLFANPSQRKAMGERAYQVSLANTGALEKHLAWINRTLEQEARAT
ncbi:MAG: 3-deoxy-D-manno-octulosonic acid transferase [Coxiella sp. RIFCSPHIGHO2_12_FULL_44_14]|nr:MAG: 3-deoxy-D-manno-octulosonic acid transferase [Coxiella sp. RIFCSPHIGHO2_12_FULL_44_14]